MAARKNKSAVAATVAATEIETVTAVEPTTALAIIPSETTEIVAAAVESDPTLIEGTFEVVPESDELQGTVAGIAYMTPFDFEHRNDVEVIAEAVVVPELTVEEIVDAVIESAAEGVELTPADVASLEEAPKGWTEIEGGAELTSTAEPTPEPVFESEPTDVVEAAPPKTFADLMGEQTQENVDRTLSYIASELDERAAYENHKNPDNDNIHRTLKKARSAMSFPSAARFMLAAAVSPSFINAAEREGARFNVYAIGKITDLIQAILTGAPMNAINDACLGSLFAFRSADKTFTHKLALASASNKVVVEEAGVRKLLRRHTVSASTASTQASSTMNALRKLGIVREWRSGNEISYHLTDAPIVEVLAARYAA